MNHRPFSTLSPLLAALIFSACVPHAIAASDANADFASPVVSVTQAQIDAANPRAQVRRQAHRYTVIDGPMNMLSHGQRWLSTHVHKNGTGGVRQVMSGGTVGKPFQSAIWSKRTCSLNRNGFCQNTSNGADFAFTTIAKGLNDVTESLWFVDTYQPGGRGPNLLGIIHEERVGGHHGLMNPTVEYDNNPANDENWGHEGKTRLGLAWSTDYGNTWAYVGRIIVPSNDLVNESYNITGAPYIVRGEHMYLYYIDSIEDSGRHVMGVSRAKIADVIEAAQVGSIYGLAANGKRDRVLWHKYYDPAGLMDANMDLATFESHFRQPANKLPAYASHALYHWSGTIHTQSMYSAKTNTYYLPLARMSWGGNNARIVLYHSPDGRRWKHFRTLSSSSAFSQGKYPGGSIYCSLHDVNGAPNHRTWDQFHVSCTRASGGVIGASYAQSVDPRFHGIWRWKVVLSNAHTIYSQSRDFSGTQTGDWTYHYGFGVGTPNEAIHDFTQYSNGVWHSASDASARISSNEIHPGTKEDVVLKWTAPKSLATGTQVQLGGILRDADPRGFDPSSPCTANTTNRGLHNKPDGVFGRVIHRSAGIDHLKFYNYIENGDTVGKSVLESQATFAINPGDEILFVVNAGGNNRCDTTLWDPSVELL